MKILITGGCGFVGTNLATEVLRRNEDLFIFDNLSRNGSAKNLEWLKSHGNFDFYHSDIRMYNDVENVLKKVNPDVIFHLSGQVAMTTSIENPRLDFEINTLGTLNVLEVIRKNMPEVPVLFSSTNKVYGDFKGLSFDETPTRYICHEYPNGFDELFPLDFHSPYGCSKGSADQYFLDYNRIYGLKTVVFRHSSMYGSNQNPTYDQGWIGWFCQKALEIKKNTLKEPFTISGTGKQVRDVLHAADVVSLYYKSLEQIDNIKGQAFNIGGGIENSLSILELFDLIENEIEITMNYRKIDWRQSDQKVFVADITKAKNLIGWQPLVSKFKGIRSLLN